jgi:thioesterase domain-containing protein/acyl carrier protein
VEAGWLGTPGLTVLCGGEALSHDLASALRVRAKAVWNVYGPTETTIWSAVWRVETGEAPIVIGRPIANTEMYVCDQRGHPQPVGVTGELYIGGHGLARGYRNRPDLTAERFVPDTFSPAPGARLYRTGDLARWRPNGTIECLGRMDHQVKIRGYRIELGEIENALCARTEVKQAVVIIHEEEGEKRLVAYIVPLGEPKQPTAELRDYLKQKLPDYMVPSVFVFLDALPLTPNGKVDRKALPFPVQTRIQTSPTPDEPRDILEYQLIRLWEKVLRVNPVRRTDDFFDLGGHSLIAVQLFAKINKLTGRDLPLVTLFQAPTVEKLADVLRSGGWSPPWSSLVLLSASGTQPPLFLMHNRGGNVLGYYPLAQLIGKDRPVYALQARGLDGSNIETLRIEEMASHYLEQIRSVQPSGPYYLGGYCFGGMLAIEAAQQLLAQCERVALLVLINTETKDYWMPFLAKPYASRLFYRLRDRIALEWYTLAELPLRRKFTHLQTRGQRMKEVIQAKIEMLQDTLPAKWYRHMHHHSMVYHLKSLEMAHGQAWVAYSPKPYAGKVILFYSTRQPFGIHPNPMLGWNGLLIGQVQVHEVRGFRRTMLDEQNVQSIASVLTNVLELNDGEYFQ